MNCSHWIRGLRAVCLVTTGVGWVPFAHAEPISPDSEASAPRPIETEADIDDYGQQLQTVAEAEQKATNDFTKLQIMAGGIGSSGNGKYAALLSQARFKVRRSGSQFALALTGNYAWSSPHPEEHGRTIAKNLQGHSRYDWFLGNSFAAFAALTTRNDRFQGLTLRTNFDPGIAWYPVNSKSNQLWFDAGYDFQYDLRDSKLLTRIATTSGEPAKSASRHGARLAAGVELGLNSNVQVMGGVEYLQCLGDFEFRRTNIESALSAALFRDLSFGFAFGYRYDHAPLPTVKKSDIYSAAVLIYQMI